MDRVAPESSARARRGVARRGTLAGLVLACLAWAGGALAQSPVALEAADGRDGARLLVAGEPQELAVRKLRDGQPAAGEPVWWQAEGDGLVLEPLDEATRGADPAAPDAAGSARVRVSARVPGRHGLVARSPRAADCRAEDCPMISHRFVLEVAAPPAAAGGDARWPAIGGALAAAALAVSAADGGGSGGADSKRLSLVSGAGQNGLANTPLAQPIVVLATDGSSPAAGVGIQWQATGGATLSAASATTGADGRSQVFVTSLGPGPGPVVVSATRADNAGATVQVTFLVDSAGFEQVSGDGQTVDVGDVSAAPLVVRTLLNGAPQAGVVVQWQVTSGPGSPSAPTSVSDANGLAQVDLVAGAFPGAVQIEARRADAPHLVQVFNANVVEPRALEIVSGDGQSGAQLAPLPLPMVARATFNGAPQPGVTLLWFASGGASLDAGSTVTDANGEAQVNVTSLGLDLDPVVVTAVRADQPAISVDFVHNVLPPSAGSTDGDGQQGLVGQPAALPLQITVVDGAGNPMPGQQVNWQVLSGSASLAAPVSFTDGAGVASVNFSFGLVPGPVQVLATAFNGAVTATFSATALAPGNLAIQSGDAQVGDPGDTLPIPLVVRILDPAPDLSGVPVTFTVVTGLATVSSGVVTTDTNGDAGVTVTLGLTPGPVEVQASVPGGASALFTLNVTGTLVVTGVSPVGGDGQTLTPGQPSAPMEIELIGNGVPLAGEVVQWTTSSGTLAAATTVTDANGRTSNTVTPAGAGTVVVTASFPTVAAFVGSSISFTHNVGLAALPTLSINEASVAEALDAACAALQGSGTLTPAEQDLLDQCLALVAASASDPAAVGAALTAMLPDVAQAQADAGRAAVGAQYDNLTQRLGALRSGAPMAKVSFSGLGLLGSGGRLPVGLLGSQLVLGANEPAPAPAASELASRWGVFVSGNIGRAEAAADRLTPRFDVDIEGLTLGADMRWSDALVLGMALGYTRQDTRLDQDLGRVRTRGLNLSAYASWYHRSEWYVDGVLTYGRNRYDHRRRIAYVLPTEVVDQVAVADSDGDDLSLVMSFGRDFPVRAWNFGVQGKVAWSRLGFDAFEERVEDAINGNGLALRVQARDVDALSATVGGSASWVHSAAWGVLTPRLQVEWVHDLRAGAQGFEGEFIEDPTGTPIRVLADDLDAGFARVGFSLSMVLSGGRSGFVSYERMLGRQGRSQESLSLGMRWEF